MFYRLIFIFTIILSFNLCANELTKIKSFQAKFQQEIVNASNKKIIYTGDVFIKKEGKILWRYQSPIVKNVYVVKNIAMIDEPELEQVIYTQLQNDMNLISLVQNAKEKAPNHYVSTLQNIEYNLYFMNNILKEVKYTDELENSVTISFIDIVQDVEIPNDTFQFFPPSHYDIIRQ